jgi:hypothetical protein
MGRLSKYGIALAPSGVITGMLKGTLDLWSYDYRDPANAFRDQSVRLRNLCDESMGQYTAQLRTQLHELRQNLPQPTRENPYPSMEGLEAVKALDGYIREVEALRVQVRSAISPPNEFVLRGAAENEQFLSELVTMDRQLLQVLSDIDEDTIAEIRQILNTRRERVRSFVAN